MDSDLSKKHEKSEMDFSLSLINCVIVKGPKTLRPPPKGVAVELIFMLPTFRTLYARGAQEAFSLSRNFPLGYCGIMAFVTTLTITAADKDAMQPSEPANENFLRIANLHEGVISALRKEEILDREMFVALDSTEDGLAASGQITSRRKTKSRRRSACSWRADHDAHVRLDIPREPIENEVRPAHSRDASTRPNVLRSLRGEVVVRLVVS